MIERVGMRCLDNEVSAQQAVNTEPPANDGTLKSSIVEGVDYYLEGAAIVFTAQYHLRRGTCCGNGCRHCPYKGPAAETAR